MMSGIVEPVGGRIDYIVPLLFTREHQQSVATYAGVVHQHTDMLSRMGVVPCGKCCLDSRSVGYIELQQLCFAAG